MSRIVGIDLGTTNSLVAAVDVGIPYVIAGAMGNLGQDASFLESALREEPAAPAQTGAEPPC